MSLLSKVRRLRGSFRITAFEETMDAELRHHLAIRTDLFRAFVVSWQTGALDESP
jgi:hypothetical protein